MQSSKHRGMPSIFPAAFSLGSLVQHHPVDAQLSATSGLGCPSRFAGSQRTVAFTWVISGHALARQARRPWPLAQSGLNTSVSRHGLAVESLALITSSAFQAPSA